MNNSYQKIKDFLNHTGDGVLITRQDSFLGEYYPPEAHRLADVSGFTGSAGLALLTKHADVLFVDSRYTLQAKTQSSFTVFEVPTETLPSSYISTHLKNKTVWFNPHTHAVSWVEQLSQRLKKAGVSLKPLSEKTLQNFFGKQRFVQNNVFDYAIQFAGESASNKKMRLKQHLIENKWDFFLISTPENVSWLQNLRSKTVPEYPVIFERGFIDKEGNYTPLTHKTLSVLKGKTVALEENQTPLYIYNLIKKQTPHIINAPDIINFLKAVKNPIEIQNIRLACLYESAVICRFLAWLETNKQSIDEMACDQKLIELRRQNPLYIGDSFETIAAVGEHAARAHYRADKLSNTPVTKAPLLLVDTGGHYLNGTTDMTRTIATGTPTPLMKRRYTQVLQGHIDLAQTLLKPTEKTSVLDKKAHAWLKKEKATFLHATGHGIGLMLAVHEMPPVISPYDTMGLKENMLFSNEPAFYSAADKFGIRLENMLISHQNKAQKLWFENLIFAPFDYRLIDFSLLTEKQKTWLQTYHQAVYDKIFPMLSLSEQQTLLPFVKAFHIQM